MIRSVFIKRDVHDQPRALAQRHRLLADRQQQIFFQPPIEKHADPRINAHDAQVGEFADHRVRRGRCRDEPILGVAIDKHINELADRWTFFELATRQQDFAVSAAVEIKPRGRFPDEREQSAFTDESHVCPTVPKTARMRR